MSAKQYRWLYIFHLTFITLALPCMISADQLQPRNFSISVRCSSSTADITLDIPSSGCVKIVSQSQGEKAVTDIWGPQYMNPGRYRLSLPAAQFVGKKGYAQLFTLKHIPEKIIGRSGRGERQFIRPMGMGWDISRREIYVADTGNDRIVRFDPDGGFLGQFGGFGLTFGDKSEEREDSLDEPWDVAPGGFSNFYVSDKNNDRICEFDNYKSYRGAIFPGSSSRERLSNPKGVIVDPENNIWVVDGRADRVLKLSARGDKLLELGGFGWSSSRFKDPVQIDVDRNGMIYICDRGNARIAIFDRFGTFVRELRRSVKSPSAVAIDPDGLIYICDDEQSSLAIFTRQGTVLEELYGCSEEDPFRMPADIIALDSRVYLLDSGNHRIAVFKRVKVSSECSWQAPAGMIK